MERLELLGPFAMEVSTSPQSPNPGKVCLVGMTRGELAEFLKDKPNGLLRSKQLATQMYRRAEGDIEQMADLPKVFRTELAEQATASPLQVAKHAHSTDDVDKLLVHKGDGQVFECVLLPYRDRVSCCLSSQVGCPMGCAFCATGLGGFERNLSAGEIVGQYLMLQRLTERRISHVVFMGMGEPLLNLKNLLKSLRLLHDEVGLSYRHLTVSTVGIVPGINDLAKEGLPIHLALSLHSPFDDIRNRLMPVNHKWPVAEVMAAMRSYQRTTGRKITIEYLLIKDVTDTLEQATALASLVRGVPSVVNVIPYNWVDTEQGFARPPRESVQRFRNRLASLGVNVTERAERGHDIAAACGQLAGQHAGSRGRFKRGITELSVVR